jgi:hypothetical protein
MISLLNKSPAEIAILTSKDPCTTTQLVTYACASSNPRKAVNTPGLLKTFRVLTGGDGLLVTRKPRATAYDELTLIIGRRGTKSTIAAVLALAAAFDTSTDTKLGPGEDAFIIISAPTQDGCTTIMQMIAGRLDYAKIGYQKTGKEIRIEGRPVIIRITVANEVAPRGKSVKLAILEEAQMLPSNEDASGSDTEVVAAIKGALINLKGRLIKIGTPWIKAGVLWNDYKLHFGKVDHDTLVLNAPTWVANPTITKEETQKAISDPRLWRREFGAEFSEGQGNFLLESDIERATGDYVNDKPRIHGIGYAMSIDWATRNDFCCVVVCHREVIDQGPQKAPKDLLVVDCIRFYEPPAKGETIHAESIVRNIVESNRRYGGPVILRDIYSGDVLDALFRQYAVKTQEVSSSVAAQAKRFSALGARFRTGSIKLPNNVPEAVKQLSLLEETLHQKGRVEYSVPSKSGHDDFPDALSYLCDPLVLGKLFPGGDLTMQCSNSWDHETGQLNSRVSYWMKRNYGGNVVFDPCLPPSGSPDAIRAALERRSRGESCEGDALELEGVDPADWPNIEPEYAPVVTRVDPMSADHGVRYARGMSALQSINGGMAMAPRTKHHDGQEPTHVSASGIEYNPNVKGNFSMSSAGAERHGAYTARST